MPKSIFVKIILRFVYTLFTKLALQTHISMNILFGHLKVLRFIGNMGFLVLVVVCSNIRSSISVTSKSMYSVPTNAHSKTLYTVNTTLIGCALYCNNYQHSNMLPEGLRMKLARPQGCDMFQFHTSTCVLYGSEFTMGMTSGSDGPLHPLYIIMDSESKEKKRRITYDRGMSVDSYHRSLQNIHHENVNVSAQSIDNSSFVTIYGSKHNNGKGSTSIQTAKFSLKSNTPKAKHSRRPDTSGQISSRSFDSPAVESNHKLKDDVLTTAEPKVKQRTSGKFGSSCSETQLCGYHHGLCLRGKCTCELGYSYEINTNKCVTRCNKYGEEFTMYKDAAVPYCNAEKHRFVFSSEDCIQKCLKTKKILCVSVEHHSFKLLCQMCNETLLGLGENIRSRSAEGKAPHWKLFYRHCE